MHPVIASAMHGGKGERLTLWRRVYITTRQGRF